MKIATGEATEEEEAEGCPKRSYAALPTKAVKTVVGCSPVT
jgi:hypothetical protein